MKQGFRKNRVNGMAFGVCAGLADQFGFDVMWTRIAFVGLTLLGFGLPLLLYIAIAIIARWRMPPENSCGYMRMRRAASGMRTCSSV